MLALLLPSRLWLLCSFLKKAVPSRCPFSHVSVTIQERSLISLNNCNIVMEKGKVIKFILECVKYIVSAAIGYFGGNAVL